MIDKAVPKKTKIPTQDNSPNYSEKKESLSDDHSSFHHPNAEPSEISHFGNLRKENGEAFTYEEIQNIKKKKLGCFKQMFVILDERYLKPFLVYKYSAEKVFA